jgi:hypothetical protein
MWTFALFWALALAQLPSILVFNKTYAFETSQPSVLMRVDLNSLSTQVVYKFPEKPMSDKHLGGSSHLCHADTVFLADFNSFNSTYTPTGFGFALVTLSSPTGLVLVSSGQDTTSALACGATPDEFFAIMHPFYGAGNDAAVYRYSRDSGDEQFTRDFVAAVPRGPYEDSDSSVFTSYLDPNSQRWQFWCSAFNARTGTPLVRVLDVVTGSLLYTYNKFPENIGYFDFFAPSAAVLNINQLNWKLFQLEFSDDRQTVEMKLTDDQHDLSTLEHPVPLCPGQSQAIVFDNLSGWLTVVDLNQAVVVKQMILWQTNISYSFGNWETFVCVK